MSVTLARGQTIDQGECFRVLPFGLFKSNTALNELDAGFFQCALDGGEVVAVGYTAFAFEIDDHVARNGSGFGQLGLVHIQEAAGGAALGG